MWVESELGRGTTVGFSLPIPRDGKEVRLSELTTSAWPRSPSGEPLVLVLHDDARALSLLRRHVAGYEFVQAETVARACEIARDVLPVAIITDSTSAGRSDTSALELGLPSHIPLLACPLPSMRRLGHLLGAADYLPKPITQSDLWDALSRLPEPPRSVLIVDDNPHFVRLLGRMLRAIDPSLRILEAFGGKEGLEIARLERLDVMLLDLVMPGVDGYALLEEMAGDQAMTETHVIIVSVRSVAQEAALITGEVRLACETGFSLTRMLEIIRATLSAITQPSPVVPGDAAAVAEAQPG